MGLMIGEQNIGSMVLGQTDPHRADNNNETEGNRENAEVRPTTGPLPGEQWVPVNAGSGEAFISSDYCCQCARTSAAGRKAV